MFKKQINMINFSLLKFIQNLLKIDIMFNLNIFLQLIIRIKKFSIKKIKYMLRLIITLNF